MEGNGWKDRYIQELGSDLGKLEIRVRSLETFKDKFAGGIFVLSALGAIVGSALTVVLQWVISRFAQ